MFRESFIGRWFFGREENERRAIALLAVFTGCLLFWAFVWKPVVDWRSVEQNRHQNNQQLMAWLQSNQHLALQPATDPTANQGSRALIPVINNAAKAARLQLNRMQPEANGVISVMLQAQAFNEIMQWIAQLEENNGVLVQRASFDGLEKPGYVNAQIRLN